jgi:hypothetical protein
MRGTAIPHKVLLTGEVVEMYERDGKHLAKIALRAGCIDVVIDIDSDTHLGDTVAIDAGLSINKIETFLSK